MLTNPLSAFQFSRVVTSDSTTLTAGCVGQSELTSNCTAVYASLDDLETTSICCNSDKCNNGTYLFG